MKRLKLITIYRIREHTNHWDPPEEPLGHKYIHSGFVILNRIRSLAHIQLMQVIRYFLERIDSCTQIISLMKHPPLPPPHPTHTAINLIVFFYNYKFRRLIADLGRPYFSGIFLGRVNFEDIKVDNDLQEKRSRKSLGPTRRAFGAYVHSGYVILNRIRS